MDNLSEHKFDDLFREGSEKVEFEYREDAWAALDERLEEKERKRRWLWILLGLTLSAFVVGSAFYFLNTTQNGASKIIPTEENIAITKQQTEVSEATTAATESISTIAEENANASQIVNENKNTAAVTNKITAVKSTTQQAKNSDFAQNVSSTNGEILKQNSNNFPILIEIQEEFIPDEETGIQIIKQDLQNLTSTLEEPKKLALTKKIKPIAGLSLQEITNDVIEKNATKFATETKLLEGPKNQFSVGAFSSLDFNSLSLGNDKIEQGYRIGLRTDYNFARRFSLGVGAAFSRKTYTAQGFRYNAKPGFWTDGIAPIEVAATCNVIEIPLELRYYAKGHNQNGFFAGVGINSYHIALEQYDFRYEQVLQNTINDWEERGTNTNLFSVAAFTVGYQKTINSNLAFQVAPYINLPISGIGQGNVNLQSVGLNIAVNWRN